MAENGPLRQNVFIPAECADNGSALIEKGFEQLTFGM